MLTLCIVVSAFLAISSAQVTNPSVSTTQSDACKSADTHGIIEEGCWGYSECQNNVYLIHKCNATFVFQKPTGQCVLKGTSGTECDNTTDCAHVPDGMYANVGDHCHSYFRCYGTANVGQFYCPAFLAFNDAIQSCDFPNNIVVPCGSKPAVPAMTLRNRRGARRPRRAHK